MILQPQKASESAGATTSCAISRMFLGRRPVVNAGRREWTLQGHSEVLQDVFFLGVLCEYVRDEVLHIMKLFTKKVQ